MRFIKKNILLIAILTLGLLLRVVWLDRIPSAISGDELLYVLEAKSVALSGKDLTGTWNPLSVFFFKYPPDELQAELPYILNIPIVGLTHFSLFTARLTSAILSTATILALYLLTAELLTAPVALYVASIAAINPWSIYIGRTAYDNVPAVCFYLWAMYLMMVKKGKLFLWSMPLFVLAFYSYIGTKVIFIPIIFLSLLYVTKKYPIAKNYKQIAIFITFFVFFISFYLFSIFLAKSPARVSDIIHLNDSAIVQIVDSVRKTSIRSFLIDFYVNKYTVAFTIIATKLLRILSFDYLFTYGDKFFSIYTHGFFYFIDAAFLVIGLIAMYVTRRRMMFFLSGLMLVSTLPHLIHSANTNDFSPHITMMFPFMMVFIGYGVYAVIQRSASKYHGIATLLAVVLYVISLGNFLQIYWFQHPLSGQFDFPVRVMSKYVQIQPFDRHIIVYSPRTTDIYKKYLFYSDGVQKQTLPFIKKALASNNIQLGNVTFSGCDAKMVTQKDVTAVYSSECGDLNVPESSLKITRLKDGGQEYRIYNDTVCLGYNLKPYPSNFTISDLNIEPMDNKRYCEAYIVR